MLEWKVKHINARCNRNGEQHLLRVPHLVVDLCPEEHEQGVCGEEQESWKIQQDILQ